MRCPDCGIDPARIVALEPIDLVAPQPAAPVTPPVVRPSRAELERRIRDLEAELAAPRRLTPAPRTAAPVKATGAWLTPVALSVRNDIPLYSYDAV